MNLFDQLHHLDELLLGQVESTFGQMSGKDQATTNAYLVLAHAVIEEHLESAFQGHYDRLAGWAVAPMVPLEVARLALAVGEWLPESLRVTYKKREFRGILAAGRGHVVTHVRENHGIKRANVQSLAKMLGLDWRAFDDALNSSLADLETLGAKRGAAGHLSPFTDKAVFVDLAIYPENVREWVEAGREAVLAVCDYLDELVTHQQPLSLIGDWDGN